MNQKIKHRIIKFRTWSPKEKEFCSIFVNWTSQTGETYGIDGCVNEYYTSQGYVFQQFTGLTDSKNKEIYEGDYIKLLTCDEIATVIWNNKIAGFEAQINKIAKILPSHFCKCEIIGNNMENPKLLKNK